MEAPSEQRVAAVPSLGEARRREYRPDARTREGRADRPEVKCEACGEPIENPRAGQRFCYWPRTCRKSRWAEEHRRPYLVERPPRPCEFCGEPMRAREANQRFCRQPKDCRQRAGYDRTRPNGFVFRIARRPVISRPGARASPRSRDVSRSNEGSKQRR